MKILNTICTLIFLVLFTACSGSTGKTKESGVLKHAHFSFQLEDSNPNSTAKQQVVLSSGVKMRLQEKVLFTNNDLVDGYIRKNEATNYKDLWLIFSSNAASRLKEVTRANKGRRLAILVDGQIWMAPRIIAVIPNGKAVVTGYYVQDLIDKLVRKIGAKRKTK